MRKPVLNLMGNPPAYGRLHRGLPRPTHWNPRGQDCATVALRGRETKARNEDERHRSARVPSAPGGWEVATRPDRSGVAQSAERGPVKAMVAGSSPAAGALSSFCHRAVSRYHRAGQRAWSACPGSGGPMAGGSGANLQPPVTGNPGDVLVTTR